MPHSRLKFLASFYQIKPLDPDRGAYTLTMREDLGTARVLDFIGNNYSALAVGADRLHVGWGSFRNLDIMAARQSSLGLLLDVNLHQFRVWSAVRDALGVADNALDFVDAVVPLLPHQPRLRQFSDSTRDWLLGDFARPNSWLFSQRPDRFEYIHRLFCEGRIQSACIDLRGVRDISKNPFKEFAEKLSYLQLKEDFCFDTLYLSNIPWMLAQPRGFFGEEHSSFVLDKTGLAITQVQSNLAEVAPLCNWVISAARLSPEATKENLQWVTEVFTPEGLMAKEFWRDMGSY